MRKRSVEEPSAPEVQVDIPSPRMEVQPEPSEPSVELAQPSLETNVSEECSVVEESLP